MINKKEQLNLLEFKSEIAATLVLKKRKVNCFKKRDRPSSSVETEIIKKAKIIRRRIMKKDLWFLYIKDNIPHWSPCCEKRGRCKNPNCLCASKIICLKYQVHLCFTPEKNRFLHFHTN